MDLYDLMVVVRTALLLDNTSSNDILSFLVGLNKPSQISDLLNILFGQSKIRLEDLTVSDVEELRKRLVIESVMEI